MKRKFAAARAACSAVSSRDIAVMVPRSDVCQMLPIAHGGCKAEGWMKSDRRDALCATKASVPKSAVKTALH